ncbi:hypothetical protein [Paludisphaera mucosa]|uniref:Uncharacterized protein n=1 Tax=Paludisphaera mucosa TaxID=3030827 RepID=A0ABT6FA81_9BACT|nr:hypothetical protein [Paludisphaera mucosa]MDG3004427.1 hypothetical protein [Paludisphaera mucosa]
MKVPLLLCLVLLGRDEPRVRPEPLGRFDARLIPEASGVVRSRRRPDVFWVHNDSGNAPVLFAVRKDGKVLRAFDVAAPNLDWEDVAIDDRGRLYIGDIGDNKGFLRLRAIYRVDEPDPSGPAGGPLKPTAATFYARSGDDRFDAEGLVIDGDRAVIVTKRFDGREAELREVAFTPPAPLLRPTKALKIGVLPGFVDPATGADLSADGRRLAVCGIRIVRVYERPNPPAWDDLRLAAEVPLAGDLNVEGIAWDDGDLIVAGEGGGLDRLAESTWKARRPGAKTSR